MLKIKDNVDLKELYNFGFYKSGGVYQKNLEIDDKTCVFDVIDICVYIVAEERIIRFSAHDKRETIKLDTLYDLIKARNSRKSIGGNMYQEWFEKYKEITNTKDDFYKKIIEMFRR